MVQTRRRRRATEAARDSFGWRVALDNATIVAVFPGGPHAKMRKMRKTTAAIFPRGSKKRKSNNDDKHDHGQEKRRPSTLCGGKRPHVTRTPLGRHGHGAGCVPPASGNVMATHADSSSWKATQHPALLYNNIVHMASHMASHNIMIYCYARGGIII